jgi:hypothetical protein
MPERIFQKLAPRNSLDSAKPLCRLQQYLVELKVSVILCRELLVEVKELVVLLGLITFFAWGMVELFLRLYR